MDDKELIVYQQNFYAEIQKFAKELDVEVERIYPRVNIEFPKLKDFKVMNLRELRNARLGTTSPLWGIWFKQEEQAPISPVNYSKVPIRSSNVIKVPIRSSNVRSSNVINKNEPSFKRDILNNKPLGEPSEVDYARLGGGSFWDKYIK